MMKKLGTFIFLSSTLGLATAAHANFHSNWLLGVEGGYGERTGNFDVTTVGPLGSQTVFRNDWVQPTYLLGLLGGFQASCNDWLLGLELNVDWQARHKSTNFAYTTASVATPTAWSDTISFKRDWSVGLSARAGYFLSSYFMPYVRLGVETSRDKLTLTGANTLGNVLGISHSHSTYRWVGGVGAEMPLPQVQGLTIRAEYNYVSSGTAAHATGFAGPVAASVSWKPHTNLGKVALVWNFL